jgi:hypothetical protein
MARSDRDRDLMEKTAHRRRPGYLKLQLPDQPPPKITASGQLAR